MIPRLLVVKSAPRYGGATPLNRRNIKLPHRLRTGLLVPRRPAGPRST
jgi:hypothetical protein